MNRDRMRMTGKMPFRGRQPEDLPLRRDQQQFVERVLVIQRDGKFAADMAHGHWQERHVLVFLSGADILGSEAALACARRVAAIALGRGNSRTHAAPTWKSEFRASSAR